MERYSISFSAEVSDRVTVEDSLTSLHLEFIRGAFDTTQEWFFLCTDAPDASEAARATQEMSEWLVNNHRDLLEDDEESEETAMIEDILDTFDNDYISLCIEDATELKDNATLYIVNIKYVHDSMVVPFIHFQGENWLFTPWDWQTLPKDLTDIEAIKWRVNDTGTEGIMFDGLPRLAPWIAEIENPNERKVANRKRIGKALKEARKRCGYSVLEAERISGVARNIISRTEAGRANTTLDSINALAECYGCKWELVKD